MKVTFKNRPKHTGLYAVGNRAGADVKFGGKRCGTILDGGWRGGHRVQIAVKIDDHPGWGWVMPRHEEDDLKRMKEWVKENFAAIVGDRELHFFED
jgi:hypothetical protein